VRTKNSVWKQELQLQKADIIKSLNKKLIKTMIKDLRFI